MRRDGAVAVTVVTLCLSTLSEPTPCTTRHASRFSSSMRLKFRHRDDDGWSRRAVVMQKVRGRGVAMGTLLSLLLCMGAAAEAAAIAAAQTNLFLIRKVGELRYCCRRQEEVGGVGWGSSHGAQAAYRGGRQPRGGMQITASIYQNLIINSKKNTISSNGPI